MFINVLGSCANQILHREGVAILVESNNANLLIDCGPGIVSTITKSNRSCSSIDNLLLTHSHGDHILGFAYFVWNRHFEHMGKDTKANDLNVYGKRDTIEFASYMLSQAYPSGKFPFGVKYHVLDDYDIFLIENMSIKIVPADHSVPTVSCLIEAEGKKLVYSSDTLPTEDLLKESANADLLIYEGMFTDESKDIAIKVKHSTARNAGKFASMSSAKQLLLIHISPALFGKENILISEAREEYSGPIGIPIDGSVFII